MEPEGAQARERNEGLIREIPSERFQERVLRYVTWWYHNCVISPWEPKTEILGAPDLFINRGSTINLTCVVLQSPEPPAYIFWNHNDAIISYDSTRGGVSVVTEKGDSTTSFLLVQEAKPSDSGRYTCNPSNAQPKSITVHVLNGE
ncbi:hypothetical protein X777_08480 [Ooceraea biroi]|uniref:Ig-like domain-containing protein n=1 Tax=Ooceraea biroi TaxID=2015173 RepID=A0A026WZU3_OOCBI|nr:hypothetical protein X777_08480 [Ooceraea biroi]